MKDIRLALRAALLADPTINGLVGGLRIHAVRLPQGQTASSIVYNRISETGDYHTQGPSGLAQTRMQVDCWAQTQDAAVVLASAVYDRLSGFSGPVNYGTNSPQDQIVVRGVFLDTGREDYDDVAQLYRMSRDYLIWYLER
jgi:hypothetical protein